MKPGLKSKRVSGGILAFGAHPDDLEFGCGGVLAAESARGRSVQLVVCSQGEAGTYGTPRIRTAETKKAAAQLGAQVELIRLDGDAHLEIKAAHAIKLAAYIRRFRPEILLAPSVVENQHPDHWRLGKLVRDAARLARYGGLKELKAQSPHAVAQLLFYAVTPEAEPKDISPLLYDISAPETMSHWRAAMLAHASQVAAQKYVELQITRARLLGVRAGVEYAQALFPNDPIVVNQLAQLNRLARQF